MSGALEVGEDVLAVRVEQAQVLEALQRRLGAADLVQAPHERQQRPVERPLLHLVLLRVEVLLAPLRDRDVLEVLVARVDPVRGRERRREHEPRARNAGGPPSCRYSWRMSGVFAKKFGR